MIMRTLVAYYAQTGNTGKIAEAIYGEIPGEKEIRPLAELKDLEGYDLDFFGFPIQAGNPAREAGEFLAATGGRPPRPGGCPTRKGLSERATSRGR